MLHRWMRAGLAALLVTSLLIVGGVMAGCAQEEQEPELVPKIEPPAIKKAGVLRAAIDLAYPPFGGTDKGQKAGLDVDVASALAAELGLELEIVDTMQSDMATALAEGDADIAMSIPFDEDSMSTMSLAGSYYADGSAFFVSTEDTATEVEMLEITGLRGMKVAAQEGSSAFWTLEYEFGEGGVTGYPTLREALEALEAGEVDVVAGDALIAAYIARDMPSIRFAGQMEPALLHGVGVSLDATELEESIRETLDALAADGVLSTIRVKWVGDLPDLETTAGAATHVTTETATE